MKRSRCATTAKHGVAALGIFIFTGFAIGCEQQTDAPKAPAPSVTASKKAPPHPAAPQPSKKAAPAAKTPNTTPMHEGTTIPNYTLMAKHKPPVKTPDNAKPDRKAADELANRLWVHINYQAWTAVAAAADPKKFTAAHLAGLIQGMFYLNQHLRVELTSLRETVTKGNGVYLYSFNLTYRTKEGKQMGHPHWFDLTIQVTKGKALFLGATQIGW